MQLNKTQIEKENRRDFKNRKRIYYMNVSCEDRKYYNYVESKHFSPSLLLSA